MDLWQLLRDGGSLAVLSLAVLGVYRGWWVPGWLYRSELDRSDRLEKLAWSLTNAAEKAVDQLQQQQPGTVIPAGPGPLPGSGVPR